MNLTNHAKKRISQRGLSRLSLEIIEEFGRYQEAPGGVTKVYFGKKETQAAVSEFKKLIQLLDKTKNGTIVIADNMVLTAYKH
jgi:hypothetical protein